MRMRNPAYRGTLEDDGTLKWKFYNEWCFWTLHWYRLIALRFCTIVPVGSSPSRWCMAQILIWIDDPWLKQFPADRWPSLLRAQILAQQHHARINQPIPAVQSRCPSLSVFIAATAFWRDWGSAWHGFTNLGREEMPLNVLQQAAYRSYSRRKFYCVVNSTWWIWWSAAGATLRPLKPITLVSFGVHYLNMHSIMIKSALRYHGVTVRLFP